MNFVYLTLDITPPTLEIFSPRYTTKDTVNHITIKASEEIGQIDSLYIKDSMGVVRNLDFSFSSDTIEGFVKFNDLSVGDLNLYVQVSDKCLNKSKVYAALITLKDDLSFMKIRSNIKEIRLKTKVETMSIKTRIE